MTPWEPDQWAVFIALIALGLFTLGLLPTILITLIWGVAKAVRTAP